MIFCEVPFMKKFLSILLLIVFLAVLCAGGYRYYEYQKYAPLREDYRQIAEEEYNAVFFSTFPVNNYNTYDYEYYREIYPIISSYTIPDLETLQDYFVRVSQTLNEVETVYLGIRPDILTADDLFNLMNTYPDKHYHVILAYPSLEYWQSVKEEEFPNLLNSYTDFVRSVMYSCEDNEWLQGNLSLYFYGSTQWLVGNAANYESDFNVNAGISHVLSMYTDTDHGYLLTEENYEEELETFQTLIEEARQEADQETAQSSGEGTYPDLSGWDVVFFGDSIMAFEETSSIPGAFLGLTKAHVYNCSKGGSSATADSDGFGIVSVTDAFLSKDLSTIEPDSLMYKGMSDYFEHSKKKRQKCFVLDFGMNDYYCGFPVKSDAAGDVNTFSGAMVTAVEKLQAAYPDAVIVLMTTNFTSYFGNGSEPQSEAGGTLPDYVAATISIAESKDLLLYDDYTGLGIDSTNHTEYLLDGTHPNEVTRFRMAGDLARLLSPLADRD